MHKLLKKSKLKTGVNFP